MKDLLYLKDEQIKEFIRLLYYAHRETSSDSKKILSQNFFGPAHLRALNLIERNPGINLGELIFKLKVTKQSLNRVLRDLIKSKMIKQIQDENDTRKKNLFLDKEGKVFFETVYKKKKKRIFNALKNSNSDSVIKFKSVLDKIINNFPQQCKICNQGFIFKNNKNGCCNGENGIHVPYSSSLSDMILVIIRC